MGRWPAGGMAGWGVFLTVVMVTGFISRLVTVWILTGYPLPPSADGQKKQRSLKTLIVLGSGGHTAEILNVVRAFNFERYQPRCYIAALTDNHSLSKAQRVEEAAASKKNGWRSRMDISIPLITGSIGAEKSVNPI